MSSRIIIYRRLCQAAALLLIMLIPVLDIFRLELGNKKFILFGQSFFLGKAYLLVFVVITLILFLIILSRVLGRVYCGWMCPQNTWAEIGEDLLKRCTSKKKKASHYLILALQISWIIALTLLFCLTILFYFIPPQLVWQQLLNGQWGGFASVGWIKLSVFGIVNMLLIRHSFCWSVCPYGFFQRFLANQKTLRINFTKETCNGCRSCERACFMKLHPRELDLNSCINCGDCAVACANQARRRAVSPSLGFASGAGGVWKSALPDMKTVAVLILIIVLAAISARGFVANQPLEVAVTNEFVIKAHSTGGWVTNYYMLRVSTSNDIGDELVFSIAGFPGEVSIQPDQITLPQAGTREVELAVALNFNNQRPEPMPLTLTATPLQAGGAAAEEVRLFFTLPLER